MKCQLGNQQGLVWLTQHRTAKTEEGRMNNKVEENGRERGNKFWQVWQVIVGLPGARLTAGQGQGGGLDCSGSRQLRAVATGKVRSGGGGHGLGGGSGVGLFWGRGGGGGLTCCSQSSSSASSVSLWTTTRVTDMSGCCSLASFMACARACPA